MTDVAFLLYWLSVQKENSLFSVMAEEKLGKASFEGNARENATLHCSVLGTSLGGDGPGGFAN